MDLLDVHRDLDERFLLHQEALFALDLDTGRERLRGYDQALSSHIAAEEELLIPIYRRSEPAPGGAVQLFLAEHRKMLALIKRFREFLELINTCEEGLVRRIIRLLDEEATFKHLVEHHDLREHNILYPVLDGMTNAAERHALITQCKDYDIPKP